MVLLGIAGSLVSLILISTMLFLSLSRHAAQFRSGGNQLFALVPIGIVLLTLGQLIYRRLQTLRFIVVPSTFYLSENIALIGRFLQEQNIAFYHSSEAPEVFQISSTILNRETGQREIMVFIADNQRVLVNSHFTSERAEAGFKATASRENRKMAKALRQFIEAQSPLDPPYQFSRKIMGR